MPVEDDGIHFPGTAVYLDPERPRGISILSSARFLAPRRYVRAICTQLTADLVHARSMRKRAFHPLVIPPGQTVSLGALSITLYPSGLRPDGNIILVEENGFRTLYWKGIPNNLEDIEELQGTPVDRCIFHAPPPTASWDSSLPWTQDVKEALQSGRAVLLRVPPIGTAHEVVEALQNLSVSVSYHPNFRGVNDVLKSHGIGIPEAQYRSKPQVGSVLVSPTLSRSEQSDSQVLSFQIDSPLASCNPRIDRFQTIDWFKPHSFDSLAAFLRSNSCREVLSFGVHGREAARELSARGFDAHPLGGSAQLNLEI